MADGWHLIEDGDGSITYRLDSWSVFHRFLDDVVFAPAARAPQEFIWRGQRLANWPLDSSLFRLFRDLSLADETQDELERRCLEHLMAFKYASRGRRQSGRPIGELDDNEWWALGQHYGLNTPLLDWTRSPFAAAYFAFEETPGPAQTRDRVVYGLDYSAIVDANRAFRIGPAIDGRPPILDLVDPLADDNPRLVNQGGVFTRAPINIPVETWVSTAFEGQDTIALMRIEIPDSDRNTCLRSLDRMNINHMSLFPDLGGASRCVNLRTALKSEGN